MTPTWTNMMTTAAQVTAMPDTSSPSGGSTGWIVDTSGNIHYYDKPSSSWVPFTNPSGTPVSHISASTDGSLIAVDGTGTFLLNAGAWSQLFISAYATASATIGDINNMVIVDSTNTVTKSCYTVNTLLASGPTKISATAGLADIWGTTSANAVNKWNASSASWSAVSGKSLVQLHASYSSAGALQIVGIDAMGKGWTYNGTTWASIQVPNPGDKFAWIEAGAGYIWAVLQTGAVYQGHI